MENEILKDHAKSLELLKSLRVKLEELGELKPSAESTLAKRKLQECIMWLREDLSSKHCRTKDGSTK